MSIITPTPIVESVVFGYVYHNNVAVEGATIRFTSEQFLLSDNHIKIDEEVSSDVDGRYQASLPQTIATGQIVNVQILYDDPDSGKPVKREYSIVVPLTDPVSLQEALAEDVGGSIVTSGPQGPAGPTGATGAAGSISTELVADISNPTEIELLTLVGVGLSLQVKEVVGAGPDLRSFYIYDANGPAKNAPYVMNTGDGGTTRWIADVSRFTQTVPMAADGSTYITTAQAAKLAGIETGATADQTDAEIKIAYENNADTNAFTDAEQTKLAGIAAGAQVNTKETWFSPGSDTANDSRYSVRSNGASASSFFSFKVPHDFTSIVSMDVIFFPIATDAASDVDLFSSYGAIGEDRINHQESSTVATYNFVANILTAVNIAPVFSVLAANDVCGLEWDQTGAPATRILGLRLRYN